MKHARAPLEGSRVVRVSLLSIAIAFASAGVARALLALIAFFTQLAYYGRVSFKLIEPGASPWGAWAIGVPIVGGIVVGLMAHFGSKAIRGHGIPEAMEKILADESRIPARLVILKPLSSAIAIGTGGPFGAEGPIIATGGALGSLVGQLVRSTADERKTLLAAGAAAGMTAIFGTPVSAVLLAVELLLFEWRPRSLVPVALAAVAADTVRLASGLGQPFLATPESQLALPAAIVFYAVLGGTIVVIALGVTAWVYRVEDFFEERLPLPQWAWPAAGGAVVGVVGYFSPQTLGVGYGNIEHALSGDWAVGPMLIFCACKFVSWSVALGSGTSGGTLAPLLTIGGGLGAAFGAGADRFLPSLGVDPKLAALVGMSALFSGCSRTFLASAIFALEATGRMSGMLPVLCGCAASYFISCLARNSIMTEKIVRRGIRVPMQYSPDPLDLVHVADVARSEVRALSSSEPLADVRARMAAAPEHFPHQGYPVVGADGRVLGVLTRKELLAASPGDRALQVGQLVIRAPVTVTMRETLREALLKMAEARVGRLPVVSDDASGRLLGIITRSDLIERSGRRAG